MSDSKNIIIHTLQTPEGDSPVWQRPTDGYFNATQFCQASGKLFNDWHRLDWVTQYIQAVSRSTGYPVDLLVQITVKGPNKERGTWIHPRLALRLAQWCSPQFAAQVDEWLEAWLKGEIGINLQGRSLIRMMLYPTAAPWMKTFPEDFYWQMSRLYHIHYDPKKGAPAGMYAAGLTDKLIYSRFPEEVRQELKRLNPVIDDSGRRAEKHFQYFKKDAEKKLDYTIDLCTRIMAQFSEKNQFETAWDFVMPREQIKQMWLLPVPCMPENIELN